MGVNKCFLASLMAKLDRRTQQEVSDLAHKDVCLRFLGASIREASWGRQPSPLTPVTLQEPLERVRLACRGLSFVLGGQPMTQIEIHCGAAVLSLDTTLLWVF